MHATCGSKVTKSNYFAGGRKSRTNRAGVHYRIGQVFTHKKHGYKGMIVGWDREAKAPDEWFEMNAVALKDREGEGVACCGELDLVVTNLQFSHWLSFRTSSKDHPDHKPRQCMPIAIFAPGLLSHLPHAKSDLPTYRRAARQYDARHLNVVVLCHHTTTQRDPLAHNPAVWCDRTALL